MITLQILAGLHLLFAGVFVGSNVFLDFLLTPRLDFIPPGQAARLGEKLGIDFAVLSWISLLGLPTTGLLLLWRAGGIHRLLELSFYTTGYGSALLIMMTIWLTLAITGAILTFYLRPRVVVKLPYDVTRQEIESARERTIRTAQWMRRLARYNAIASMVNIVIGGFLRYSGFLPLPRLF
jgi:uncharacterized membrane protein